MKTNNILPESLFIKAVLFISLFDGYQWSSYILFILGIARGFLGGIYTIIWLQTIVEMWDHTGFRRKIYDGKIAIYKQYKYEQRADVNMGMPPCFDYIAENMLDY